MANVHYKTSPAGSAKARYDCMPNEGDRRHARVVSQRRANGDFELQRKDGGLDDDDLVLGGADVEVVDEQRCQELGDGAIQLSINATVKCS